MNSQHYIGIVITLAIFIAISVYAGFRAKKARLASAGAPRTSAMIIAGAIMGTLVGGSSTVGTAQLAYQYGMSAWWFTLGGGIGCLILALTFVRPLRNSGSLTLVCIVSNEYGRKAGVLATIMSSVGIFINILSQLLASAAAILVIAPTLGMLPAILASAVLMFVYVAFGGIRGAGMVGVLKLILLYFTVIFCAITVLHLPDGGLTHILDYIRVNPNKAGNLNWGLFSRGVGMDVGAGLSLIFGILTTQTYGQAILSGRSDRSAKVGALVSAVMVPPVGICGILVGLYMRTQPLAGATESQAALTALTEFIRLHTPPLLGGAMLATLIFAAVGTGAGLALGISMMINNDIIRGTLKKKLNLQSEFRLLQVWIAVVLVLGVALSSLLGKETIQSFAYMSMGLRGSVMLLPLAFALFAKGKVNHTAILVSIIAAPIAVALIGIVPALKNLIPFDGLFAGIALSLVICIVGFIMGGKRAETL
ncbi:MAG: sodium:solute symporter family protein [Oscillospiraceae bacterium]|jgi:SSS family solute:Na+ symporter|nr:sodium:solute symporter family protein [Oscillospiraceae bacterium]